MNRKTLLQEDKITVEDPYALDDRWATSCLGIAHPRGGTGRHRRRAIAGTLRAPYWDSTVTDLPNGYRLTLHVFAWQRYDPSTDPVLWQRTRYGWAILTRHDDEVLAIGAFDVQAGLRHGPDDPTPLPGTEPGAAWHADGVPCVALATYSGGAHCCFVFHVIRLEPTGPRVATIRADHSSVRVLGDPDEDGDQEIAIHDWTFAYWLTSYADSPTIEVILGPSADHAGWTAEPALMRRPIDQAWLNDRLAAARQYLNALSARQARFDMTRGFPLIAEGHFGRDLVQPVLTLLSTGHPDAAWAFVAAAWPEDLPDRDAFEAALVNRLRGSPHWPPLERAWGLGRDTTTASDVTMP